MQDKLRSMSKDPAPVDFAAVTKIQDRAVLEVGQALREANAVLVEAPTGAGKTRINARIMASLAAEHPDRKPKVLNLQHRELLALQGERALNRWSPEADLTTSLALDGNLDQSGDAVYATVQTVAARLDQLEKYDAVTVDEGHHLSDSKNSDYSKALDKLFADNPDIKLITVTATPNRPDKKGLSPHLRNAARVTIGWAELERAGQIKLPRTIELRVPGKDELTVNQIAAKHYNADKDANSAGLTKAINAARPESFHEDMADAWERYNDGRRTIAYHSTIEGARAFADEIASRGYRVGVVDSQSGKDHNVDTLDKYAAGELDMVVSVKMIDEGIDVPSTRCILILRPTTSEVEYSQMVGRSVRTGEDPAIQNVQPLILDAGASTMIHGAIERRAAVIDYYQKLERGEHPHGIFVEKDKSSEAGVEAYSPWRKVKDQPVVLALSDGEGVIFAIESRDAKGEARYSLAEAQTVKGRRQVTFMKDDNGKPLNGIDGTRLHHIEAARMLPSRANMLRLESTRTPQGNSMMDERLAEASQAHMSTIMHFAAMTQGNARGR